MKQQFNEQTTTRTLGILRTCGTSGKVGDAMDAFLALSGGEQSLIHAVIGKKTVRACAAYAVRLHENTTVGQRVADKMVAGLRK